jgi:hypothetical protein
MRTYSISKFITQIAELKATIFNRRLDSPNRKATVPSDCKAKFRSHKPVVKCVNCRTAMRLTYAKTMDGALFYKNGIRTRKFECKTCLYAECRPYFPDNWIDLYLRR